MDTLPKHKVTAELAIAAAAGFIVHGATGGEPARGSGIAIQAAAITDEQDRKVKRLMVKTTLDAKGASVAEVTSTLESGETTKATHAVEVSDDGRLRLPGLELERALQQPEVRETYDRVRERLGLDAVKGP